MSLVILTLISLMAWGTGRVVADSNRQLRWCLLTEIDHIRMKLSIALLLAPLAALLFTAQATPYTSVGLALKSSVGSNLKIFKQILSILKLSTSLDSKTTVQTVLAPTGQ